MSMASRIDPITLEIQWQRLISIVDEMDTATIRASFSSIVGESHDFGCILMDQDGNGIGQAQWSPPQFCTMLPITTKHMINKMPKDALRSGDVMITNDPWMGSTHLPDYNLVSPVFHKGKLIAFMGTVAHVSDVGGHLGDLEAADMFQEGTRVMPTFFYRDGQPVELVHEFISANCRVPDMVMGDLNASVGTHKVAIRRMQDMMNDYDLSDIQDLACEIMDRSEAALRRAISALPDGVSEYEVVADGYMEPFTLKVKVEVRGSDIYIDFAGSSLQQRNAAINAAFNMTYSTAVYPIKCMLAARVPNNDGLVRPLHISAPLGSIVNCTFPAPVKARAKVMKHIPPVVFGALAKLLPGETIAAAGGIFPFYFSGTDSRFGTFSTHVLPHGGLGATRDQDGWLPTAYPHNSFITPAEIMELQCPVLMLNKELIIDSGGAGRSRGGPGQEFTLKCVAKNPITLTIRPDLLRNPAPGIEGGLPGRPGEVILNGVQVTRFLPMEMKPGDLCILRVPGGGGYGDPKQRESVLVKRDVGNGLVSPQAAREIYGVEVESQ